MTSWKVSAGILPLGMFPLYHVHLHSIIFVNPFSFEYDGRISLNQGSCPWLEGFHQFSEEIQFSVKLSTISVTLWNLDISDRNAGPERFTTQLVCSASIVRYLHGLLEL